MASLMKKYARRMAYREALRQGITRPNKSSDKNKDRRMSRGQFYEKPTIDKETGDMEPGKKLSHVSSPMGQNWLRYFSEALKRYSKPVRPYNSKYGTGR